MKKIIKPGTRKTIECNDCGCVFTYEAEDIESETSIEDAFNKSSRCFVVCPQCSNYIVIAAIRTCK